MIDAGNGMFFGYGYYIAPGSFDAEKHIATNELVVSPPYIHYAFPRDYALTVDSTIIGLGRFGNTVVVLTNDKPYLCVGSDPTTLNMVPLPHKQACVSRESIVSAQAGVIYASPDGLFMIGQSGEGSLVTKGVWDKQDWNKPLTDLWWSGLAQSGNNPEHYRSHLLPSNLHGCLYEGRYYAFWRNTPFGFVLDPDTHDVVYIDLGKVNGSPTGSPIVFSNMDYHSVTDSLYMAVAYLGSTGTATGAIWEWEGQMNRNPALKLYSTWQSADFQFPAVMSPFTCARIQLVGDTENLVGFQLYGDGVAVGCTSNLAETWGETVTTNNVFRLPAGKRHDILVSYERKTSLNASLEGLQNEEIFLQKFNPPTCQYRSKSPLHRPEKLKKHHGLIRKIENLSLSEGVNPSFYAALIAQESSFNPQAVSHAKAIGLSQVTDLAQQQIFEKAHCFPEFPS
jgi:hypothetical protein